MQNRSEFWTFSDKRVKMAVKIGTDQEQEMRTILLLMALMLGPTIFDCVPPTTWAGVQEQDTENSATQDKPRPVKQWSEMELMERVELLQHQLQDQQISVRDTAEKELKSLDPVILDFLEIPDEGVSSDTRERMLRIRQVLEKLAVEGVTQSSRVSLKGTFSVVDALAVIKKQTRNDVAIVDQAPDEFLTQKVVLDLENAKFWTALDQIMKQAKLVVAPYSGGRGQLRLRPKAMANQPNPNAAPVPAAKTEIPRDQAGIFDITVTRIDSSRNLVRPENDHTIIHLLVRWEPRIQPISVEMAMKDVKIIDEFDKQIEVANDQAVVSGIVQPQIPELEFSIPIKLVDRQIEEIKSFTATINAVLPGRIETFKFKNLGDLAVGAEQSKAGVSVSFAGARKNDDIWSVQVNVGFDESNEATESYQGWIFENEVYLIDDDKNRQDFIGYESFSKEESKLGVQYLFDVDPSKYTLIYKSPAAIVKTPIVFTLKKIPLP